MRRNHTQHTHIPDDFDFAQLRGAFDSPIATSPRFAAQLKEDLMAELTASDRVRPASIARSTRDKGQISRVQTLTATSWQGTLITIAAILTVLVLSFASLRYVNNSGGDNDTHLSGITHFVSGTASPEATPEEMEGESSAVVGGRGGSDRSFNLGAEMSELKENAQLLVDSNPSKNYAHSQVIGGLLLRIVQADTQPHEYLEAIDLATGESIWTYENLVDGGFSSDGNNVFVLASGSPGFDQLTALDLKTGEITWSVGSIQESSMPGISSGTLYAEGIVYASFNLYSMLAVDSETGKEIWKQTYILQDVDYLESGFFTGPGFAIMGETLFTAWEGRFIEASDRRTGEILWSTDLYPDGDKPAVEVRIMADEKNLYVNVDEFLESDTALQEDQVVIVSGPITAIDQVSGDVVWKTGEVIGWRLEADAGQFLIATTVDSVYAIDKQTGIPRMDSYQLESIGVSHTISAFDNSVLMTFGGSLIQLNAQNLTEVVATRELTERLATPVVLEDREVVSYQQLSVPHSWNTSLVVASPTGQIWIILPAEEANEINALESSTPIANLNPTLVGYGGADRPLNSGATLPSGLSEVATGVDLANSPLLT